MRGMTYHTYWLGWKRTYHRWWNHARMNFDLYGGKICRNMCGWRSIISSRSHWRKDILTGVRRGFPFLTCHREGISPYHPAGGSSFRKAAGYHGGIYFGSERRSLVCFSIDNHTDPHLFHTTVTIQTGGITPQVDIDTFFILPRCGEETHCSQQDSIQFYEETRITLTWHLTCHKENLLPDNEI